MNIYRFAPNSNTYEDIYARVADRGLLYFYSGQPLSANWLAVRVDPDKRLTEDLAGEPVPIKGDFPSLYNETPVFSERAWNALAPLIGASVEALPLLHPSGERYLAINVLDVVDCLDLAKTKLTRNDATGRVSSIQAYQFKAHLLKDKHMFKLPETKGLEVLVSEGFKKLVKTNGLKGLIFRKLT